LFAPDRSTPAPFLSAVRTWQSRAAPSFGTPFAEAQFVAVDTETSGLDVRRDRLLALGACRVSHGAIAVGECFEVLLKPDTPSQDANILVHGIGRGAQAAASDAGTALAAYLEFAHKDVVVGFRVQFDLRVLGRALREQLGVAYEPLWLDLGVLLPALFPRLGTAEASLDHWQRAFGLRNYSRHRALADAECAALLLLAALQRAQATGRRTLGDLLDLQHAQLTLVGLR
jgi:DNA polymerase-3 subunit epsilon